MDGYFDALSAVVLLLAALAGGVWGCRRFGVFPGGGTPAGRRLQVIESLALDPRRRLVIVRRDDVEHVLLLGPAGDLVVPSAGEAGDAGDDAPN